MRRILIILIALTLALPCYAQDFVYFKKKAAAGGGGPTVEYFDPTSTVSNTGSWYHPAGGYTTTDMHLEVDDGVRSPTDPSAATDEIWSEQNVDVITFGFTEPSAAVASVKVWAWASVSAGSGVALSTDITRDGTTYVGVQSLGTLSTTPGWKSYEYTSLGWNTPTDFRVRLQTVNGNFNLYVEAMYVEVTYQ